MIDDAAPGLPQARPATVADRHAPLTADHDAGVAALWRAVLQAALADAGSPKPRVRKHIAGWVGSPDFWTVVEAAGLDPRRAAVVFRQALAAPARPLRARRGGRRAGTVRRPEAVAGAGLKQELRRELLVGSCESGHERRPVSKVSRQGTIEVMLLIMSPEPHVSVQQSGL